MAQQKDRKTGKWMYYGSYVHSSGKRIQYKKRGFLTKKEARKAEDQFREEIENKKDHMSFEELYNRFIKYHKKQVKKSTVKTDEYVYKKLLIDFKNESEYTNKKFLQDYINKCDSEFSRSYVSKIFYCLRKLFSYAVREELVDNNPMDKIKMDARKNEKKKEMSFWEPIHFDRFIKQVNDPMYRCIFMTLYYMGMRKGEMMALNWNDIDLVNKTIRINKTIVDKDRGKGSWTTDPKTKNSFRTISIPDMLVEELKSWELIVKSFRRFCVNGFVFGNERPISPETLRRKFIEYTESTNRKYRKEEQIPIIRIHDLRHSHASFLINNMSAGFTDFDIAKRLGDTVATLHNTYAHWFKAADKGIIDFMNQTK